MTQRCLRIVACVLCLLLGDGVVQAAAPASTRSPSGAARSGTEIPGLADLARIFYPEETQGSGERVEAKGNWTQPQGTPGGSEQFATTHTGTAGDRNLRIYMTMNGFHYNAIPEQSISFGTDDQQRAAAASRPVRKEVAHVFDALTAAPLRAGNGFADLILVFGQEVYAFLNHGDGTFANPTDTHLSVSNQYFTAVAIGDITGDGKPDAVITDANNNTVIVLPGNGDGTFGTPATYSLGATNVGATSVAVADLNGDGKVDVVTGNVGASGNGAGSVSVLLNNGSGGLGAATSYSDGATTDCSLGCLSTVRLADLNGDNRPDIVTALTYGGATPIAVLLNTGAGAFAAAADYSVVGSSVTDLAIGDVNNDHHPDIAFPATSGVAILLNNGNGTFAQPVTYTTGVPPIALDLFDQTGDGNLDLIAWSYSPPTVLVLPGKGDGTFPALSQQVENISQHDMLDTDVNGDNHPDLITLGENSDFTTGTLAVRLNDGNGNFTRLAPGSPITVNDDQDTLLAAADFTGDNKTDLVVVGQNFTLYTGDGTGNFPTTSPIPFSGNFSAVAVADLGNGHPDLILTDASANNVTVLLNDGHGNFTQASGSPIPVGASPRALAVADLGNGHSDLVVSNHDDKTVSVLLGNGTGTFTAAPGALPAGGSKVALADVNGDHKADLIAEVLDTQGHVSAINVSLSNGNGTFAAPVALPTSGLPNSSNLVDFGQLVVADLNADGVPDIAVEDLQGLLAFYAGHGDGTFAFENVYAYTSYNGATLRAADLNGDGITDLELMGSDPSYDPGTQAYGFVPAVQLLRNGSLPASAATHLVFSSPVPSPLGAGTPFAVEVRAEDAHGNIVSGYNASVTLTLNGGSGLTGTLTQTMSGGGALFQGLNIANAGTGLTLTATSGSLTGVSSSFSVGGQAAPPNPLPNVRPGGNTSGSPGALPDPRSSGATGGNPNPLPNGRP